MEAVQDVYYASLSFCEEIILDLNPESKVLSPSVLMIFAECESSTCCQVGKPCRVSW